MSDETIEQRAEGHCPVIEEDYTLDRPAFWHFANLDRVRESAPVVANRFAHQYWMINRYDEVKEALQRPDVFTNDALTALVPPETITRLLPQNLNPPEHVWYRQVLNPWFSPGSVKRIEPLARERCIAMIEELAPAGSCDMASGFAMQYPTEIFLAILGLPVTDGVWMLPLVEAVFRGFFGVDLDASNRAVDELKAYYAEILKDREANPGDPKTDFVTHILGAKVNGEPVPREDILTMCFTIMLAGLDTTRSQLGYIFHHLATHPDDRRMLLDKPELIPSAVEEFLRLYGLLIQDGRYVAQDIDFHGCPMKKGDLVWLGLAQASRDPRKFDRPDEFVPDREFNKHMGFAAGAHRCLGAHLARSELVIVLEEWLTRIPDFDLAGDGQLTERGGQVRLNTVPLRWVV